MNNKVTITVKIPSIIKDVLEKNMSDIPNCNGAYVIKAKSGKLYVGSSKTLRNRISQHKDKLDPNFSVSDTIVSTCYYQTNTHEEARIMENWLIREINPELNKTNKHDKSEKECGAKCSQNCETWNNSPGKNMEFDVNIIETCKNISEENFSKLPKNPGVYIITSKMGNKYVGSSINVCSRVKEHHSLKGGNVNEPIKSVSCYITENRTDAYIFEYFKISELKPELNREFRDDAWTWKFGELAKHFEEKPELEELFKEFSECVCSNMPDINEVIRKNWVTYQTSALKNIFFVKFMSGYLQVDLKDEGGKINDSSGFSWSIEPKQSDIFHRRFKLSNISEIDKAVDILTQAYYGVLK